MASVEYLDYEILADYGCKLDNKDLFEKARAADLDDHSHGVIDLADGQEILLAARALGFDWPFSCRDGICSNCAAVLKDGEVEMHGNQALPDDEIEEKDTPLDLYRNAGIRYRTACSQREASGLSPGSGDPLTNDSRPGVAAVRLCNHRIGVGGDLQLRWVVPHELLDDFFLGPVEGFTAG